MIRHATPTLVALIVIGLAAGCGDEPADGDPVVGSADRDPIVEPAAAAFFDDHLAADFNCWSQDVPPAMRLRMRARCLLDPAAEYTVNWQPPDRMAIQGEISLLRFRREFLRRQPDTPIDDAELTRQLLARHLPDAIAELERGASSALNLSSFAAAVGGQMPLLEWFARDPHGLRGSGLVDLLSDPDAPAASVVIRGIPGASLAGEELRLYLADHACCPDSMVYGGPEGALAMAFDWRREGDTFLPVRATFRTWGFDEPVSVDLDFQRAGERWVARRWTMEIPGHGEVLMLEVLEVELDPTFTAEDWEDHLEMVDGEAMEEEAWREFSEEFEARFPPGFFDPRAAEDEDGAP